MKNKSQTSKNMTESYKLVKKNDKKSQASEKKKSKTCLKKWPKVKKCYRLVKKVTKSHKITKKTKWLTCEKCGKNSQTIENKVEESDKN